MASSGKPRNKVNIESEKVEKGLVKLVLTVVELLRKLMERQAIRRMEGGSLRPRKMEELGLAFLRLDEKMKELKKFFGLKDEDLNLNLGPLGNLV
ncbi:gas vesicle protein K [Candidatus Peregrinibacteria bacterium]|nr:gas vesicle protein K [Candidatus Peregrinibacteria bacterium]